MLTCYACKRPYPPSFEWCEICKAPLLRPYQSNLFQCPQCGSPLVSDILECPSCSIIFDISETPTLSQWPEWYSWNNKEVQKRSQQLLGVHGSSDLSTKHLVGLAHSLIGEEKAQQAYAIASLASARLSKVDGESYNSRLALGLAKLFLDLKRPIDALALLSVGFVPSEEDLPQIANYYEFLGVSYLELGFCLVAQVLLEKALECYEKAGDHEAWYKSASNLFMAYLASRDRRKATTTLARMINILDKEFMNPLRHDIVPVSFYLFNQLFWSSFQTGNVQRIDDLNEKRLIEAMMKILRQVVRKGDLRFIHFIDFDRVITTSLVAGKWNESEEVFNELLSLASSSPDEQGALLLKWMGALHLAGQQEKEREVWNQVQSLLPKIREKSIRNAIITFRLREIVQFYDAKYYNELRIFPEEYSRVNLSKPSILGRSRYLPFEPIETHLGVSIVFPKRAVIQLIKMLKKRSDGFHVLPYIISLGERQKINAQGELQKELETLAILIKTEKKIIGFQFISLPKATSAQITSELVEREYELFGYLEKPDRAEGISNMLFSSLKNLQEEVKGGTVHVYISQLGSPSTDTIFKQRMEKT